MCYIEYMGTLPRKILEEKIIGFVYIKNVGLIPVETLEDKIKITALGEIYIEGFDKGYIFRNEEGELPQFKGDAPQKYKESLQVLTEHLRQNFYLIKRDHFLFTENERLSKSKFKIVFLSKDTLFKRYRK